MYQNDGTIKETLDKIQHHELVLPAIQREFVWGPDQICRLFDTLMQGYPFGTFLYWQVEPENSEKFKFYDFVREYHQRDAPHCPSLPMMQNQRLTAVLDGQQRLTALNIGLRGKMALKLPRLRWNNPDAFPFRRLYLDLLWQPDEDDEEGLKYRFDFLTDNESSATSDEKCWFPVSQVLSMSEPHQITEWLIRLQLPKEQMIQASRVLHKLYEVIYNKPLVASYTEKDQELEKVLQIFIRTNSGGTILSYSDLLLSVAVAQWTRHDAREEIHTLVDELNGIGSRFTFSKDLVLKAGLMLSDIGSVGFKVENFNQKNMGILEDNWGAIKDALTLTVQLISDFGFNWQNLSARNAILPISYYLYAKARKESYLVHTQFEEDRQAIREWLIRSLLADGIWGSGLDTLLTAIRRIIKENESDGFPASAIYEMMAGYGGKSLVFEDEEVEKLADMQYGNQSTFALLSMLFPFVDLRNHFHIDHIFPVARFTEQKLRSACFLMTK